MSLIVSQSSIKFHAPFRHRQKRQLSLLNLSDRSIIYSILTSNIEMIKVEPRNGLLNEFETTELNVWLQPVQADQSGFTLTVKYRVRTETGQRGEGDYWALGTAIVVNVSLHTGPKDEKELAIMLGLVPSKQSLIQMSKPKMQPLCFGCNQRRLNQLMKRKIWNWRWLCLLLMLPILAHFVWQWL